MGMGSNAQDQGHLSQGGQRRNGTQVWPARIIRIAGVLAVMTTAAALSHGPVVAQGRTTGPTLNHSETTSDPGHRSRTWSAHAWPKWAQDSRRDAVEDDAALGPDDEAPRAVHDRGPSRDRQSWRHRRQWDEDRGERHGGRTRQDMRQAREQARDLLRQSEIDLAAGRSAAAYQRLELIIERFPGSPEAGYAKDRLVEQFRTARQTQAQAAALPTPALPPPSLLTTAHPAAPPAAGPAPVSPAVVQAVPPPVPATATQATAATSPQQPSSQTQAPPPAGTTALRRGGDDFKQSVGDRIFFEAATARIEPRQRSVLAAQAAWLKERPEALVKLEGHADEPGTRDLNMLVARERAEAVRTVLIKEGVAPERIDVAALGNDQPLARCGAAPQNAEAGSAAELCASQNRRVVTVVGWADMDLRRRLNVSGASPPTAVPPTAALKATQSALAAPVR